MSREFQKVHANGNDFIFVYPSFFGLENTRKANNTFSQEEQDMISPIVAKLSKRSFGVGCDLVAILSKINENYYKMTSVDVNGNIVTMCGNALRCAAGYLLAAKDVNKDHYVIRTDAINVDLQVQAKLLSPTKFWT